MRLCGCVDGSGARGAEAGVEEAGDGADALPAGERVSDQQSAGCTSRSGVSAAASKDRAGGDHC